MSQFVSIIIPAFNCEKYVVDTLQSCIQQTHQNLEIIIVNDGSSDRTEELILSVKDERIKYYSIKNSGPSYARNYGLSKASGKLIQFLDADDLLDNKKIEIQQNYYNAFGDDFIYSGVMGSIVKSMKFVERNFNFYYKNLNPEQYFAQMFGHFGKYLTTGIWLTPRKLIDQTHGWDEKAGLNDDGEYFTRLILLSKSIIFCENAVFYYRRDVEMSFGKQMGSRLSYERWLYSYSSYVKNFKAYLSPSIANKLGRKALSVYYCNSYPNFPELLQMCKIQINKLGYSSASAHGSWMFKILASLVGVEYALKIRALKVKKR